jgi:hypothetical protein
VLRQEIAAPGDERRQFSPGMPVLSMLKNE